MIRIIIADPDPTTRKALILLFRCKLGTNGIVEVGDVENLIRVLTDRPVDTIKSIAIAGRG